VNLGIVIHRFGQGFSGGAEVHCRMVARRLAGMAGVDRVEVITTTARDYLTWANAYPPGLETEGEVAVRRFPVRRPRSLRTFDLINRAVNLFYGHAPILMERLWLRLQGPDCPGLLGYLRARGTAFDRLIFYTYLYQPTVLGLPLMAGPPGLEPGQGPFLIPTAHDEKPLRLKIIRPVFEQARSLGFLSPAEADLVRERFRVAGIPQTVLGAGVEAPEGIDPAAFAAGRGLGPYLLYLGRLDVQKGVPELIRLFRRAGRGPGAEGGRLALVLAGERKMDLEPGDGILCPGYLSEEEKWAALAGATAVVAPSPFESLNLTVLEAGALGRPVLVNAACRVLEDYVRRSGGGLAYHDQESFGQSLSRLADPAGNRLLGEANRAHVAGHHSWPAVDQRLRDWLKLG